MTADDRHPDRVAPALRAATYTDYVYRSDVDGVFAERAFALFLARVGAELGGLVVVGRLDPTPGRWHYRLPSTTDFVALPYYARLRRRPVVLGVRQDMPQYVAMRHPGAPVLRLAAAILEHGFRTLARFVPVIAVGPE